MSAFTPKVTYRFTVGTTAMNVTLPARPETIRIVNATAGNIVFFDVGATAVIPTAASGSGVVALAAAGCTPLVGNTAGTADMFIEKGNSTLLSMISSATTSDVYVTLGHG